MCVCGMSSTWLLSNFRKAGHETGGAAHVKICSVGCAAARQIQRMSRPVQSHSLWHRTSQCCRANQTESVPVMATVVGRLDTLTADLRHLGAMIESSRYISSLTDDAGIHRTGHGTILQSRDIIKPVSHCLYTEQAKVSVHL